MSVIQNNIDLVNATLTVKVSKEDYSEKYDKALKIARKKINVPGFRVGMAPMGMVKKMYGPTILVDEINKIVSEELYNYINENKLNILGEPLPNENSKVDAFNEGDDFEFVFDIALAPEFKVEWNGYLYASLEEAYQAASFMGSDEELVEKVKEAISKAKDILFNTDLVEFTEDDIDTIVCEAESSAENPCEYCDEDCDDDYCSEEREYLYDELY